MLKTRYDIEDCDLDSPTTNVDVMLETARQTIVPPPLPGAAAPLAQLEAEVEAFKALRAFRAFLADRQLARLTFDAVRDDRASVVRLALLGSIQPVQRAWPAPEKKISREN